MRFLSFIFTAALWVVYIVLKIVHHVQAKKLDREFDEMLQQMHTQSAKEKEEGDPS